MIFEVHALKRIFRFKISSGTYNTKSEKGKSTSIDNIPSEIIVNGGSQIATTMTLLFQKIWDKKEWPYAWVQSLIIPIPKKGDPNPTQTTI